MLVNRIHNDLVIALDDSVVVVVAGAGGVAAFSPDAAAGDSVRQLMLKTAP